MTDNYRTLRFEFSSNPLFNPSIKGTTGPKLANQVCNNNNTSIIKATKSRHSSKNISRSNHETLPSQKFIYLDEV